MFVGNCETHIIEARTWQSVVTDNSTLNKKIFFIC